LPLHFAKICISEFITVKVVLSAVKQLRRIRLIFSWPGTRLLVRIIILNAIAKTSFFFVTRTTFDLLHVWNCIEAVCYVIKCYILWRVRTWITCVISEARESKKSKGNEPILRQVKDKKLPLIYGGKLQRHFSTLLGLLTLFYVLTGALWEGKIKLILHPCSQIQ